MAWGVRSLKFKPRATRASIRKLEVQVRAFGEEKLEWIHKWLIQSAKCPVRLRPPAISDTTNDIWTSPSSCNEEEDSEHDGSSAS
eukprot:tig00020614_g12157.t1